MRRVCGRRSEHGEQPKKSNHLTTNPNQVVVVDLVADEGAVVEGDAVRQLLMREHDISRGHTHLHLVSVRVRVRVRVMLMVRVRVYVRLRVRLSVRLRVRVGVSVSVRD